MTSSKQTAVTFKIHSCHLAAGWAAPWVSRDYWLAHCLGEAFTDAGQRMVIGDADLDVWVWGSILNPINPERNNVLWVVGHPATLLETIARQGDSLRKVFKRFFCASKSFAWRLKEEFGFETEWLVCPAPTRPESFYHPEHDLAFVGNADPKKNRPALASVLRGHDSVVWGAGWKDLAGAAYRGEYIPFPELPSVWNSARIVPYSHHADMRREGFVADAALDAMVNSGALVISDDNSGLVDIFAERDKTEWPYWTNEEQLKGRVEHFLHAEPERQEIAKGMREAASRFTYKHVVERLLSCV